MIFVEFFKHQSYFLQIFFGKQPPCVVVSSTSVTRHTRVHTGNNETLPLVSQQSTCSAHNNKTPEIPQVYYSLHKKLWNFFHPICFNPKMDFIGIFSVLYHKYLVHTLFLQKKIWSPKFCYEKPNLELCLLKPIFESRKEIPI